MKATNFVTRIVEQNIARCKGKESFMNERDAKFLRSVMNRDPEEITREERNMLHNLAEEVDAVAPKNMRVLEGMRRGVPSLEFA